MVISVHYSEGEEMSYMSFHNRYLTLSPSQPCPSPSEFYDELTKFDIDRYRLSIEKSIAADQENNARKQQRLLETIPPLPAGHTTNYRYSGWARAGSRLASNNPWRNRLSSRTQNKINTLNSSKSKLLDKIRQRGLKVTGEESNTGLQSNQNKLDPIKLDNQGLMLRPQVIQPYHLLSQGFEQLHGKGIFKSKPEPPLIRQPIINHPDDTASEYENMDSSSIVKMPAIPPISRTNTRLTGYRLTLGHAKELKTPDTIIDHSDSGSISIALSSKYSCESSAQKNKVPSVVTLQVEPTEEDNQSVAYSMQLYTKKIL